MRDQVKRTALGDTSVSGIDTGINIKVRIISKRVETKTQLVQ